MARTGLWFQFARGRAMVRNRSMRKARALKSDLNRLHLYPHEIERKKGEIQSAVRRARDAHREWRKYRKLWDAEQADNAELERRFGK